MCYPIKNNNKKKEQVKIKPKEKQVVETFFRIKLRAGNMSTCVKSE